MRDPKDKECAWSITDEQKFIEGLGGHSSHHNPADLATTATLLARYRAALCRRAAQGTSSFSIPDALLFLDKRLGSVRAAQLRTQAALLAEAA